jgi:type III secretion system-like peptide-binding chaperone
MIEYWISRQGSAQLLSKVALVGIVAMTLLLLASAAPAAKKEAALPNAPQIAAYVEKWRCPVAAYLQGIYQLPPTNDDRYLILWAKRRPALYVQCIFHEDDQQIYCEAPSGFYRYADRAGSFATPARLDALAGLGFSTDGSKGNWAQDGDFHSADETAMLMLETLARVFAASGEDVLEWGAPLLSKRRSNRVKAGIACAPVSAVEPSSVPG